MFTIHIHTENLRLKHIQYVKHVSFIVLYYMKYCTTLAGRIIAGPLHMVYFEF